MSTFAGQMSASECRDGTGSEARFGGPMGIATDATGNVYVADWVCHTIRKITPAGTVTTFAGNERGGRDGVGAAARFGHPAGVAVDRTGNVYVTDWNGLRKITPSGVVSTLAGRFDNFGFADGRRGRVVLLAGRHCSRPVRSPVYGGYGQRPHSYS